MRQSTIDDPESRIKAETNSLLKPGRNVWRVERAARAAVLIDGAAYFEAARKAMLQAEDTIHIVGWDLDSRMRLVGPSGRCDDDFPETLVAFLSALVERRPQLHVRLLLWDYSLVFSLERELTPLFSFLWRTPPQIEICLDDLLPLGAAHHQKLVTVDDAIAFSGGLDLTARRWDTPRHEPGDPLRTDPSGAVYPPFHDVQMMVDGAAAQAVGELVRMRWERATCEKIPPPRSERQRHDLWPQGIDPDFREVRVGIARTMPAFGAQAPINEVAALFADTISRAERLIYVENQFLTSAGIAERIAARMAERPKLEVVIVVPRDYPKWVERLVMLGGRRRFMAMMEKAGCADRVRVLYPEVGLGERTEAVKVHSKVMIIDDEVLRVGSANLCNRSMGLDSECDLVVIAEDEATRQSIAEVRRRMLAEHSGLEPEALRQAEESDTSLLETLRSARAERRLVPVEDALTDSDTLQATLNAVGDPIEPLDHNASAAPATSGGKSSLLLKSGIALGAIALAIIAWRISPIGELDKAAETIAEIADRPWAPAAVIGAFIVLGFMAFPVTLLIFSTIAAFGGWSGAVLAGLGAMASAVATYLVGRWLGARYVRRLVGPRINRMRRILSDRGVVAVASMRLVPLAPFTVVNLIAGAIELSFLNYIAGTFFGLLPGLLAMSALGHQVTELFKAPTVGGMLLLLCFVLLWMLLVLGVQLLIGRYRDPE